jgi:hypothetical protein
MIVETPRREAALKASPLRLPGVPLIWQHHTLARANDRQNGSDTPRVCDHQLFGLHLTRFTSIYWHLPKFTRIATHRSNIQFGANANRCQSG